MPNVQAKRGTLTALGAKVFSPASWKMQAEKLPVPRTNTGGLIMAFGERDGCSSGDLPHYPFSSSPDEQQSH